MLRPPVRRRVGPPGARPAVVDARPSYARGVRRDGQDEEFRRFVQDHRPALVRAASALTAGDRHLAEDVVQSALTRLYVHWTRVPSGPAALAYARRVLVNCFVDQTRRAWWRRERSVDAVPDRPSGDPAATDPDLAALRALPPRMRAVLVLRFWFDLDVARTAAELGCSEGTVRSQTARALSRLRADPDAVGALLGSEQRP